MGVNKKHVFMREGAVYLDGLKVLELVNCKITTTPELWEGRSLGDKTKSRRWMGLDHTVSISEYKSTPWLKEAIKDYISSGDTPEFTIQGVSNDSNSDYYQSYGSETITATGCVITSAINLIDLDTEGDMVKNEIEFGAKDIV